MEILLHVRDCQELCNEEEMRCEVPVCDSDEDCDDGLACNGLEMCTGDGRLAECAGGTPVECDAGVVCTEPSGICGPTGPQ